MNEIEIFAPATVANVSCGFDVLGFALEGVGDIMRIRKVKKKGVRISKITGADLPLEAAKNVAGVAAFALLEEVETDFGFEMELHKGIKAGSGIGSSAASAAGAVWGINALLGEPFPPKELVRFAMEGERLASGTAHADNVAPALLGGFALVCDYQPLDIVHIPSPSELFAVIVHPQIEIKTSDSRKLLKKNISLRDATQQWGKLAGLISGLYTADYDLISRSTQDIIVEPLRKNLILGFDDLKRKALEAGALACGISGSGPSVFALCKGHEMAERVGRAMRQSYRQTNIDFDLHISRVSKNGCKKNA